MIKRETNRQQRDLEFSESLCVRWRNWLRYIERLLWANLA